MTRMRLIPAIDYVWVVITVCVVGNLGLSFVVHGVPALFPFIQDDLETNKAQLGLIVSAIFGGGTLTVIIMGWLSDAVGVRRLLGVTMLGLALTVLAFSQIQSLVQGILLALVLGIVGLSMGPGMGKAVMDWVGLQTRTLAMGIQQTSVPIGGIMVAALLPSLAEAFDWRIALMFLALMVLISAVVFVAFYHDKPTGETSSRSNSPASSILLVAKDRNIWLAGLNGASLTALHFVFVSYLILFLKEHLGMSTVQAGFFLAVGQAGSIAGRIAWGLVSDFLLHGRRVLALMLVGAISVMLMALMATLPSNAPLVLVGILVFFVGGHAMGWPGLHLVLLAELSSPRLVGTAIGVGLTIGNGGAVVVPPLFGLIVDKTGSYEMAWWMAAGVAALGALPLVFLRPKIPVR